MTIPVEGLHDIRLPDPPPAPDATATIALIAIALVLAALVARRYWPTRRGWTRQTLDELRGLESRPADEAVYRAALVTRRLALRLSSSPDTLHAHGRPWLEQLDRIFRTDFFTQGAGRQLGTTLYAPPSPGSDSDAIELLRGLRRLVRRRSWRP